MIPDVNISALTFILIIIWIPASVLIIFLYFPLRGMTKKGKFTLSGEVIEFNIPNRPRFQISWAEFDIIDVISYYDRESSLYGPSTCFELKFLDKNEKLIRTFKFIMNKDLSKNEIKTLLLALKIHTHSINKEIYGKSEGKGFGRRLMNALDLDKLMESKKMEPKAPVKMELKVPVKKKTIIIVGIILSLVVIGLVWEFTSSIKIPADEERPDGTIISSDNFREMSGNHNCEGYVDLINTTDGGYVLYFYEMDVDSKIPKIFLSDKTTFRFQIENLGTNVEIGPLPYRLGSFSVSIPDSVDVTKYETVVIVHEISSSIQGYAGIN